MIGTYEMAKIGETAENCDRSTDPQRIWITFSLPLNEKGLVKMSA
jgi:hypothetical protein